MVTRRTALKAIASALLTPAISELALAGIPSFEPEKRTLSGKDTCTSCKRTRHARRAFSDVFASAGLLTNASLPLILAPIKKSEKSGHVAGYVESATGDLGFQVKDLEVAGASGLSFHRFYNSSNATDRGLGKGWSYSYDEFVEVEGERAVLHSATSEIVRMILNGQGSAFVPILPALTMRRNLVMVDAETLEETFFGGYVKTYRKMGDRFYLTNINFLNNGTAIKMASFER